MAEPEEAMEVAQLRVVERVELEEVKMAMGVGAEKLG